MPFLRREPEEQLQVKDWGKIEHHWVAAEKAEQMERGLRIEERKVRLRSSVQALSLQRRIVRRITWAFAILLPTTLIIIVLDGLSVIHLPSKVLEVMAYGLIVQLGGLALIVAGAIFGRSKSGGLVSSVLEKIIDAILKTPSEEDSEPRPPRQHSL